MGFVGPDGIFLNLPSPTDSESIATHTAIPFEQNLETS